MSAPVVFQHPSAPSPASHSHHVTRAGKIRGEASSVIPATHPLLCLHASCPPLSAHLTRARLSAAAPAAATSTTTPLFTYCLNFLAGSLSRNSEAVSVSCFVLMKEGWEFGWGDKRRPGNQWFDATATTAGHRTLLSVQVQATPWPVKQV